MAVTPAARRRRRRRASPQEPRSAPPADAAATPPAVGPESTPTPSPSEVGPRSARPRRGAQGGADRALSGLVGAGPSQVGVDGALRARDVNRPTDDDLAEAEREIQIVRRHWKPDDRR